MPPKRRKATPKSRTEAQSPAVQAGHQAPNPNPAPNLLVYTESDVDGVARSLKKACAGASQRASKSIEQTCMHTTDYFDEASFDTHLKTSLFFTEKSKKLLKQHDIADDELVNDWAVLMFPAASRPSDPLESFMSLDAAGWAELRLKLFPSPATSGSTSKSTGTRAKKRKTTTVVYKGIKLACLKHFGFGHAAYLTWRNKLKVCKTATTFLAFVESIFQDALEEENKKAGKGCSIVYVVHVADLCNNAASDIYDASTSGFV